MQNDIFDPTPLDNPFEPAKLAALCAELGSHLVAVDLWRLVSLARTADNLRLSIFPQSDADFEFEGVRFYVFLETEDGNSVDRYSFKCVTVEELRREIERFVEEDAVSFDGRRGSECEGAYLSTY